MPNMTVDQHSGAWIFNNTPEEKMAKDGLSDIETLKKENAELKARLDALEKAKEKTRK